MMFPKTINTHAPNWLHATVANKVSYTISVAYIPATAAVVDHNKNELVFTQFLRISTSYIIGAYANTETAPENIYKETTVLVKKVSNFL